MSIRRTSPWATMVSSFLLLMERKKVVTKIAAVKEEFSNWREDLNSSEEDQNVDTIKEMPRGKKK